MKLANERRQHMRSFQIEVVSWAIEISRHYANDIKAILPLVSLAHLDSGNLGDRIGFIRRLKRATQQVFLLQRLRRMFGIDAGGAEKKKLLYSTAVGCVDYICLNQDVVANELCRVSVIGHNAADPGCRQDNILRPLLCEKAVHGRLVGEIKICSTPDQNIGIAFSLKPS